MGVQVTGKVSVSGSSDRLVQVSQAANVGTAIMPPGGTTTSGTGSYLDSLLITLNVLTTVGSCQVQLADNLAGTVTLFPNVVVGTTTLINQTTWQIFIGATSQLGPWRLTTGGNVTVTAIGRFVK